MTRIAIAVGLLALIVAGVYFAISGAPADDGLEPGDSSTDPPRMETGGSTLRQPARGETTAAPLRIILLAPDMATPATGRTLQIYSYTPRRMERPDYVKSVRTDDLGIADCEGLGTGSYIVCAPGASTSSPEPRTARATIEGGGSPVVIRLVEPPVTVKMRIDVQATFTPRFGATSKLVFRRKDDGSGDVTAQPDLLKPGVRSLELDLVAGRYEVDVEPCGELIVRPEDRVLDVRDDGPRVAGVVLADNPARVDVQLIGIPSDELPARVYPQPADGGILDDRPERTWWGPHRWHRAEMQVPALAGPRRLLVFGQTDVFRSRAAVAVDGDRAEVELEPACRVVVDWFDWDPQRDAGAVLMVEAGTETVARALSPRFGAGYPDLDRPALGGEVVTQRAATARLECSRPDGSVAWTREIALDAPYVRVEVE